MERVRVNPVIPGFSPDPSLVYVDGTYFLVNSTFHMYPGLPVYASQDLREWKHIGNALDGPRRMTLQQSMTKLVGPEAPDERIAAQGGLMAPSIRYHKGTFYIVCTNVFHRPPFLPNDREYQNFILSTTDIWADEWSNPVFYDFNGIDTSLFWDDDGQVYVLGAAGPGPESRIMQFQIDLQTGAKLSEEKLLWEGITKVFPEGPHMYKKDGWYYLLIAEGGCFADHHSIMARSRDIWGPYEVNPANPVLLKADPTGYIQYTSHGDLFQEANTGEWYFVCLGVRKNNGRFIMGRESVLTTATWPEGEFPVIDPVRLDVPLPLPLATTKKQGLPFEWPVKRRLDRPHVAYLRIRDPVEENYQYDGNTVSLTSSKADLDQSDEPVTFTGKRQRLLDGSASATLESLGELGKTRSAFKTGLCYYKDEYRFVRVYPDMDSQEIVWEMVNKARGIERRTSRSERALGQAANITFGIDYTELEFTFWYSIDTKAKRELSRMDSLDMTGHDFVGPVIGIYAVGAESRKVRFANFQVEGV
ncbi:glycosyl hydrolase [Aspergillus pseudodeflectus]|uniref:Glycosyl hydrolase n=1 Tax=Aspergillus pseudodeflectus TaxID=176178 RepID=A0ABR4JMW1_9EURO